jgi:hypothetical protein
LNFQEKKEKRFNKIHKLSLRFEKVIETIKTFQKYSVCLLGALSSAQSNRIFTQKMAINRQTHPHQASHWYKFWRCWLLLRQFWEKIK